MGVAIASERNFLKAYKQYDHLFRSFFVSLHPWSTE